MGKKNDKRKSHLLRNALIQLLYLRNLMEGGRKRRANIVTCRLGKSERPLSNFVF